jgi:hypothetical protein
MTALSAWWWAGGFALVCLVSLAMSALVHLYLTP